MAASTTWAASQQKLYCNRDEMLHLHYLRQQKASLSALCKLIRRAANGRNRRALLSLIGQIKLSDTAFTICSPQLDDHINRLLNVLPHLSEGQRRARLQDHYG
jgi:hypothetical protein